MMAADINTSKMFSLALMTAIILQIIKAQEISSETWRDTATSLLDSIFAKYDKRIRPDIKTKINFGHPSIKSVRFDERSSVLELYILWSMFWTDKRLSWDAPWNNSLLHSLNIPPDMVWLPDLYILNSPNVEEAWNDKKYPVVISHDGETSWYSPTNVRVICKSNFTMWPHDTHSCNFKLVSYTHDGHAVDLVPPEALMFDTADLYLNLKGEDDDDQLISISQWLIRPWKIEKTEIYYNWPEPFIDLQFRFSISRNAPLLAASIKIPTFCLSILNMVMFLLPVNAEMKVGFGGFCLVISVLFLVFLSTLIPPTSELPLIVRLLTVQLQLLVISIIVSALILRLASYPGQWPLPTCFQVQLRMVAFFLCLQSYVEEETIVEDAEDPIILHNLINDHYNNAHNSTPLEPHSPKKSVRPQYGWVVIAAAVDRLSLFVYLFICISTISQYKSVL